MLSSLSSPSWPTASKVSCGVPFHSASHGWDSTNQQGTSSQLHCSLKANTRISESTSSIPPLESSARLDWWECLKMRLCRFSTRGKRAKDRLMLSETFQIWVELRLLQGPSPTSTGGSAIGRLARYWWNLRAYQRSGLQHAQCEIPLSKRRSEMIRIFQESSQGVKPSLQHVATLPCTCFGSNVGTMTSTAGSRDGFFHSPQSWLAISSLPRLQEIPHVSCGKIFEW